MIHSNKGKGNADTFSGISLMSGTHVTFVSAGLRLRHADDSSSVSTPLPPVNLAITEASLPLLPNVYGPHSPVHRHSPITAAAEPIAPGICLYMRVRPTVCDTHTELRPLTPLCGVTGVTGGVPGPPPLPHCPRGVVRGDWRPSVTRGTGSTL